MERNYLYEQAKGYFYAWVGQNATTGTPHPQTGRMTMYGNYLKFSTRKARDKFVNEFYSNNPSEFAVKCNVQSGRQYCLGWSIETYYEELCSLDCSDSPTWKDQEMAELDRIYD